MAESDLGVTELEETFNKAAKYLQAIASELESDQLLEFYGLYKQVTVGPCDVARPNWFQVQANHKWKAWKNLGDMSREDAMRNYIETLAKLNPIWEQDAKITSQGWVAFSRLLNTEEELSDADKTFLDWVKDGNEKRVREILEEQPNLVNLLDETGLLPIHWAADRGDLVVMECLIERGANINSVDENGQTPLHYAASCGHLAVVKYLLSVGAESIEDKFGMKPEDIADENLATIF